MTVQTCQRNTNKNFNDVFSRYLEDHQMIDVLEAISAVFNAREVCDVTLLTGGRGTSKIFRISGRESEYVCRVTDAARPNFFVDPSSEIKNMKIASDLELTPRIHYSNEKTGILIMDHIKNLSLHPSIDDAGMNLIQQLAENLSTLHNGPSFTQAPTSIFKDVEKVVKASDSQCMPGIAHEVIDSIFALEQILEKHQTSVPCHKELNGNNILFDGQRIYFIDWEASENCDPFVDLAIASIFFINNREREGAFLKYYFKKEPTAKQQAHLYLMKQVCLSFYAFKSLRRVIKSGKMDLSKEQVDLNSFPSYQELVLNYFNGCSKVCDINDFKIFTYVFLREALNNIRSSKFRESIQMLA